MSTLENPAEGEDLAEWVRWVSSRPECIQKIIAKWPPWQSYRPRAQADQYARRSEVMRIRSYDELIDGRITVSVLVVVGLRVQREVFGISPEDLEVVKESEPSD